MALVGGVSNGQGSARWSRWAVLASSILLMLPGAWGHSATILEFAQLPAGLAAWERHSFGIYRVCGPASKLLYALPAYLAGFRVDYPPFLDSDVDHRQEWNVGRLYQAEHVRRYLAIYRLSRLLPVLVTIVTGWLICEWATLLFGTGPGLISLCIWCWLPPVLAHGPLVTSDVLSALTLILAARCFWSWILYPRASSALLTGLTLGLCLATKFTLLILYPCWALLWAARILSLITLDSPDRAARWGQVRSLVAGGVLAILVSLLTVDALYFFQDVGIPLSRWGSTKSSVFRNLSTLAGPREAVYLHWFPLPVPAEFLRGLDFQIADTERLQAAYLLGQTRIGGWWYWYPVACLFKIPLPALLLFALSLPVVPAVVQGDRRKSWAVLCLFLPAAEAALAISASTGTGTNAAFRYMLPSLAALCVLTGSVGVLRTRVVRGITILLVIWLAAVAIAAAPDHLGWQNELSQIASREKPALIGDSLEWGQDLARLGAWVSRHSKEGSTVVCVYGLGSGDPYGLKPPEAIPVMAPWDRAAYLAVSANVLFGYASTDILSIGGQNRNLDGDVKDLLLHRPPVTLIGRTIRIYRLPLSGAGPSSGRGERSFVPL